MSCPSTRLLYDTIVLLQRCQQYWTRHNTYLTVLTAMELAVCLIGQCALLAANLYVLSENCAWFSLPVFWLYDVGWVIWATMFWLTMVRICTPTHTFTYLPTYLYVYMSALGMLVRILRSGAEAYMRISLMQSAGDDIPLMIGLSWCGLLRKLFGSPRWPSLEMLLQVQDRRCSNARCCP